MTMYNNSNEKTNGHCMYKKFTKNMYVTHKPMTTTELQAPDLGQTYTYICGGVKHVSGFPTLP